jgi:hypothetical protein
MFKTKISKKIIYLNKKPWSNIIIDNDNCYYTRIEPVNDAEMRMVLKNQSNLKAKYSANRQIDNSVTSYNLHCAMSHPNNQVLKDQIKLINQSTQNNFKIEEKDFSCNACLVAKMKKLPHPPNNQEHFNNLKPGERLVHDLSGKIRIPAVGSEAIYQSIITYVYSGYHE